MKSVTFDVFPSAPVSWLRLPIRCTSRSQLEKGRNVAEAIGTIPLGFIQNQFADPCLPEDSRRIGRLACIKPLGDTCVDLLRTLDSGWQFILSLEVEKSFQKACGNQGWNSSLNVCGY